MGIGYTFATTSALRQYSDSTLMGMTKKELVKYCHELQKNIVGLNNRLEIQAHHLDAIHYDRCPNCGKNLRSVNNG